MDTDRTSWIRIGQHGYRKNYMDADRTTWIRIGLQG